MKARREVRGGAGGRRGEREGGGDAGHAPIGSTLFVLFKSLRLGSHVCVCVCVCVLQLKGVRLVFSKKEVDASSGEVYDGSGIEEVYPLDELDVSLGRHTHMRLTH